MVNDKTEQIDKNHFDLSHVKIFLRADIMNILKFYNSDMCIILF